MYFLMHLLAVITLTPLCYFLCPVHDAPFPPCYSVLAESIMGSSACRPVTQTSIYGKDSLRNNDFLLHVVCTALFNPQSRHILPS